MRHNLMTLNPLQLFSEHFDRLFDYDAAPAGSIAVDVVRSADEAVVEALLPGIGREDVELSFEDGWLTLRGKVAEPEHKENSRIHLQEIPRGEFVKRVRIGSDLDASTAEAQFENGVLRITMKVAESARPRRIEIN